MRVMKKKVVKVTLSMVLMLSLFTSVFPGKSNAASHEVMVDPEIEYQTHEGFGTSLAWWANVIGGWPDEKRKEIADLIFDPEKGLGFNVVRYNIGGGENPELGDHLRPGAEMPGFQPEPGVWDWDADKNQRWMLLAAKKRAQEDFLAEAFSNSPPYWMTYTQSVEGNGEKDNLKPKYYDAFANYLTKVVEHYESQYNVKFRTLEPVNEPEHSWGSPAHNNQEGAHFDISTQQTIIQKVHEQLEAKGLSTGISAMDGANFWNTMNQWNAYDNETKSYISQINSHGYAINDSAMRDINQLASSDGKRLWMSESDGGGALGSPWSSYPFDTEDIVPALDLSRQIYKHMKEMKPSAWVFWQAVENWAGNIRGDHNWGLIHANFEEDGTEGLDKYDYTKGKKYFAMAQYSKFIRPGYKQIKINQDKAVAFVSQDTGKLVVVQTNLENSPAEYTYDLTKFDTLGSSVKVYRTSPSENFKKVITSDIELSNDKLHTTAIGESITTYVINLPKEALSDDIEKRLNGGERFEAAAEVSQARWETAKNAVLETQSTNIKDLLNVDREYPLLLTRGNELHPATQSELERLGVNKVFVKNGSAAMSKNVRSALNKLGIEIEILRPDSW